MSLFGRYLEWDMLPAFCVFSSKYGVFQVISCSNDEKSALVIGCTAGSTHVEAQLKEAAKENAAMAATASSVAAVGGNRGPAALNMSGSSNAVAAREAAAAVAAAAQARHRLEADHTVFKVAVSP